MTEYNRPKAGGFTRPELYGRLPSILLDPMPEVIDPDFDHMLDNEELTGEGLDHLHERNNHHAAE